MIIVVDSDGLIATVNPDDNHYSSTQKILAKLVKKEAQLIYPATVIAESVTLLQGRLNKPEFARLIMRQVNNNLVNIEPVDDKTLQKAGLLMDFRGSKHHTLFDCIVAVIAESNNADAIFSFDRFYKSKGFKLALEL